MATDWLQQPARALHKRGPMLGCLLLLAGAASCDRQKLGVVEPPSVAEPPRPSPIDERLPTRPVLIEGDSVRTRVAASPAKPAAKAR